MLGREEKQKAICLLLQDEENYYLTPYTNEDTEKKVGQIVFTLTGTLTAISIWPPKGKNSAALDDVKKQLCLKFIELKNKEYAVDLQATSTVDALMSQLDDTQKAFVEAVMAAYDKKGNKKCLHSGRTFDTELVEVKLKDMVLPEGFIPVNKNVVNQVAFQHACLEALKVCIGWPAMSCLSAEPTADENVATLKLFHPFALQLSNTVNGNKEVADQFSAESVKEFTAKYEAFKKSVEQRSSEKFPKPLSKDEIEDKIKNIFAPIKAELEALMSGVKAKAALSQ